MKVNTLYAIANMNSKNTSYPYWGNVTCHRVKILVDTSSICWGIVGISLNFKCCWHIARERQHWCYSVMSALSKSNSYLIDTSQWKCFERIFLFVGFHTVHVFLSPLPKNSTLFCVVFNNYAGISLRLIVQFGFGSLKYKWN